MNIQQLKDDVDDLQALIQICDEDIEKGENVELQKICRQMYWDQLASAEAQLAAVSVEAEA